MERRNEPVRIDWNALLTLTRSRAEVSMKIMPYCSARACPSNLVTTLIEVRSD